MPTQREKILTSMAGEYFVAAELCRRGYVASLTLKNYPKVDIFALNPETQQPVAIQVKTVRRTRDPHFFVPRDAIDFKGAFVFVVVDKPPDSYRAYVLPGPKVFEVATLSRERFIHGHPGANPDILPFMLAESDLAGYQDNWEHVLTDA